MEGLTPEPWLNLGVAGAVLFILFVVIVLMFKQQSKDISKLCDKLDNVCSSFADNNGKLTEVIVSNDKDQKQLLMYLSRMQTTMDDMHSKVVRIDTRLFEAIKHKEE